MVKVETSSLERRAIIAGVRAGDGALEHARRFAFLKLFVRTGPSPNADPRLEALRDYAELRRALLPQGHIVPATSLSIAGYTTSQIAGFDAVIDAGWPKN